MAEASKKWKFLNNYKSLPEFDLLKRSARKQVYFALKSGRLKKPNHCSKCKKEYSRIEGHHEDYEKPLDVKWLCPSCHAFEHSIYA